MIGNAVLHYNILEKLGEGGMGVVYRAEDSKLKRDVALKFLPAGVLQGSAEKDRFLREAQAAASLNHPNIAHIYAIEEHEGQLFIVMEYLQGRDLSEILQGPAASAPLPIDLAIGYVTQIAAGLRAAHEKGIIHRDIKSANIMVTTDGLVKIMDFGLAKIANRSKMTVQGSTLGTAGYMSPEQARSEDADHRSDIWSLGVVLYEMISGTLPFRGEFEQAVVFSILNEEPEPLTALRSGLPIALDGIVAKALAKDPAVRYQHVDELPADLKALNTDAVQKSRVYQPRDRSLAPGGSRASWLPWTISSVLSLALMVALSFFFTRESPPPALPLTAALTFDEEINFQDSRGRSIALSPDGRLLAYVPDGRLLTYVSDRSTDAWRLHVRDLAVGSSTPLVGTERAGRPFWSPDGSMLGYFADGQLWVVSVKGGPSISLASAPDPGGGAWSEENVILYSPAQGPLFRVPAAGGTPLQVTRPESQGQKHHSPFFLPDSRHFVFWTRSKGGGTPQIYRGDLDTGNIGRIRDGADCWYVDPGYLVFRLGVDLTVASLFAQRFDPGTGALRGQPLPLISNFRTPGGDALLSVTSQTIVYAQGRGRQKPPVLMSRDSETVDTLAYKAGGWIARFSNGGSHIAIAGSELWIYDPARRLSERAPTELNFPVRFAWSHDDASVLYSSPRAHWQLRKVSRAGTTPEETIFESDGRKIQTISVSPDGRSVLFVVAADEEHTRNELRALDVASGAARRLVDDSFSYFDVRFSPNGNWYAYSSDEGSTESDVFIRPFPGPGAPIRVSAGGGSRPRWRKDSEELFYANEKDQVVSVRVQFEGGVSVSPPRVVLDQPEYAFLDAHPDGQQFLMRAAATKASDSQLVILRHWREMLDE